MKKSTVATIVVLAVIIVLLVWSARMTNNANTNTGANGANDGMINSTTSTSPVVGNDVGTTTAMQLQGRWIGPEGTSLTVEYIGATDPHKYRLSFVMLDGPIAMVGDETADGKGIVFERNYETLTLRHGTGLETGMKWLADKEDCIVVKQSEGYCRGEE